MVKLLRRADVEEFGPRLGDSERRTSTTFGSVMRRRRRMQVAGSLVAALVCGIIAIRITAQDRPTWDVLVAARDIPWGTQIGPDDVRSARLGAGDLAVVLSKDKASVIGTVASQTIFEGALLDARELAPTKSLQPGTAAVGVSTKLGQVPSTGLGVGDHVMAIYVDETVNAAQRVSGQPTGLGDTTGLGQASAPSGTVVLAPSAIVLDTKTTSGGIGGSGDALTVTLSVPQAEAAALASASAQGRVALVLLAARASN